MWLEVARWETKFIVYWPFAMFQPLVRGITNLRPSWPALNTILSSIDSFGCIYGYILLSWDNGSKTILLCQDVQTLALPIDSIIHARKVFLSFVRPTKLTPYHTLTMDNQIRYNTLQLSHRIVNLIRESSDLEQESSPLSIPSHSRGNPGHR